MDKFTTAYIGCALWAETDNANDQGGEPLDANYGIEDIAPETLASMESDCADFQESFGDLIADDLERAGHDFWLTRQGHGAGFWDGDWPMPIAKLPCLDAEEGGCGWPNLCENCQENQSRARYSTVGDFLTAMSKPYGEVNLYVGDDGKIYA